MMRLMLAAPASGSGKTTMAVALLALLKKKGLSPCAFKCGPDYIDPTFHRSVLGVECRNLDLFLSEEEQVKALFARGCAGHGAAVCEGAMGYYDGLGGTTRASAWHLADTLGLPTVLVVRPGGAELTLAAALKGVAAFRSPSRVAGILLAECSDSRAGRLGPLLEKETGLPVLGWLPPMEQARFPSRHLGLLMAEEVAGLSRRAEAMAEALEARLDWERFAALCGGGDAPAPALPQAAEAKAAIAVARDEAFCFVYQEGLEALEQAGAALKFFSPLRDTALPEGAGGLYLPGGYPELYAEALGKNEAMRAAVRQAVEKGLPTVAECGGFLYLGQTLEDGEGRRWPMAGALPGEGFKTPRLVRFGYNTLTAKEDSLLLRAGESLPAHEFHHWDSTCNGTGLTAAKADGKSWECGFTGPGLYAAFPHLYWAGRPELARRFVQAAQSFLQNEKE